MERLLLKAEELFKGAAMDLESSLCEDGSVEREVKMAVMNERKAFVELIQEMAEPRIGTWEPLELPGISGFMCSKCHGAASTFYPFCPHCGAVMNNSDRIESVD